VTILPGSEGRRDPQRADAARRQRVRFARDIGDEAGQAWAHEPRRAPRKFTIGTFVVLVLFAALGAVPLLTHEGDGGLLQPDCGRVAIEIGPDRLLAGERFGWQVAGPESGQYVVTVDAATVTVDAAGKAVPSGGSVLAGPTGLPGCRSRQTVTTAPAGKGSHEVAVFRRTAGGWERVAVAALRVS
jgi:hypothetical protein